MKFENMDLEQLIDNGVNIGEHISMDDILDNVVEEDSPDETEFVLNADQADQVIKGMANDPTITNDYWEEKAQHIWDDICYQLHKYGSVDIDEVAAFHGVAVYQMVKKYL